MDKNIVVFKLLADGSLKVIPEEILDNLETLQEYVGGNIEIVTLSREPDGSSLVMIVNDCGLIDELPVNPLATVLYQGYFNAETVICGNAIVCAADSEGELHDIPPFTGLALLILAKDMRNKEGEANDKRGS